MSFSKIYALPIAAMAAIVLASNVAVQYPVFAEVGGLQLADLLTYGSFTYPFAFLVTDLTNRRHGPKVARRVVFAGFAAAVLCSLLVPPLLYDMGLLGFATTADRLFRIAVASGGAFLLAQLLDVAVFTRMRQDSWWRAPAFSSLGWCSDMPTTAMSDSTSTRSSSSSAPATASRSRARRCWGCFRRKRRAGCPGRSATSR